MIVINDCFRQKLTDDIYVALGSFDGIHKGHRALVEKTCKLAKEKDGKSMVMTFKNHPLTLVDANRAPKLLMENHEKAAVLKDMGIDILNLIEFDETFMKMDPKDFIRKMLDVYNVKGIIVGYNYRFGHKNKGDVHLLKELSEQWGFELSIIDKVEVLGEAVSSTRIRKLLSESKIEETNELLGHYFSVSGTVAKGRQIGRTINFPTANLSYNENYMIPGKGVYYTLVAYNGEIFKGITNIGYNPTVSGQNLTIETYILDFNKEIYGEEIRVFFLEKIRDEKKFSSLNELKAELEKNKSYAASKEIDKTFYNVYDV